MLCCSYIGVDRPWADKVRSRGRRTSPHEAKETNDGNDDRASAVVHSICRTCTIAVVNDCIL